MFYDLAYAALLTAAMPWLVWQRVRYGKYRDGYREKFLGQVATRSGARRCVWFHAVSVGEVNLVGRLIAEFRERHPDWDVVVTATTSTGLELARRRYPDAIVSYAPLDLSWAVDEALRRFRPDLLVLAELELWPNLLDAANRRGTRIAVVNGRLSARSHRGYRRVRLLVKRWLKRVDWVGARSAEDGERFVDLGLAPEKLALTGSLKYDRAESDRRNAKTESLRRLMGWNDEAPIWVVGSTQQPEEEIAIECWKRLRVEHPELRLVIVPRHAERFEEVARLLERSGVAWQRRSRWSGAGSGDVAASVVLVDTIGELGAWWGMATIAFVGGSLGSRGGQNMIEPAAYGAAVCFGPETRNFRDVVESLLACRGAKVVADGGALEQFVRDCLRDPAWAEQLGERARTFVASQQGATARTLQGLERLIGGRAEMRRPASRQAA